MCAKTYIRKQKVYFTVPQYHNVYFIEPCKHIYTKNQSKNARTLFPDNSKPAKSSLLMKNLYPLGTPGITCDEHGHTHARHYSTAWALIVRPNEQNRQNSAIVYYTPDALSAHTIF